jgi:YVTN family beta-propeller protein
MRRQATMLPVMLIGMLTFCLLGFLAIASFAKPRAQAPAPVGPSRDGGQVLATSQLIHPAGQTLQYPGRPVDLALAPHGKTLYVKDAGALMVIDTQTWQIRQQANYPKGGASMHGLLVSRDGSRVYVSSAFNQISEGTVDAAGKLTWARTITVPGPGGDINQPACIWGLALSPDEKTLYACLSRNNSLAVIDLTEGKLTKEIPVGVAPYDVLITADGSRAYISNWGGRRPTEKERTAGSSGTACLADERGVACSGTVACVELATGKELAQVDVGLHPADLKLSADGRTLYVANANSDTVNVIDVTTHKVTETILVRPDPTLPFGSAPNGLWLAKDEKTLYVANGGNNAVAVISLRSGKEGRSEVRGFIPAAWYPSAVTADDKYLYVANVKGFGSRNAPPEAKKFEIYQWLGTVNKVALPSAAELKKYTAQVKVDGRVPQMLLAQEKAQAPEKPVPVPAHLGEPSVFEHVVYIIKENKTYDQVLGDIGRGNSDPALCVFGREASPNHHALAEQFVLLDNYYCNGVCSADGHSWATEGNTTDYLEKSFGGHTRAYPFGDDTLTYSSSGLIWDNVLAHGLSFRNYGEMDYAAPMPPSASWSDIYKDYLAKTHKITFAQNIGIDRLRRYSCRDYPGWNMGIPDVLKADVFLRELKEYDKKGWWPNFIIVYLPDDHTSGGAPGVPTPRAQMADNDLALGRVIEGITHSRFWPSTCIFVNEDDPQSGFDHVDGHRSLCLVISPYTKRGKVISQFYNQTAVLHTMEQMLGIPPMNQMDALAPLMTECFTTTPNFRPYTCLPNRIALDEMSTTTAYYRDPQTLVRAKGERPFDRPDTIDDDTLNRAIWHSVKGNTPYPAQFAGAHGKGLAALHLALAKEGGDD